MKPIKMKPIKELNFGYKDAVNYNTEEGKELFYRLFLYDSHVDDICRNDKYFLVGEKGTGKTAYATYLSNNNHDNFSSKTVFVQDTDYLKFLQLKQEKHLILADYPEIWKVIILLLISEKVGHDEISVPENKNFRNLKNAIDHFYYYAFRPEIHEAFQFVENSQDSAQLLFDNIKGNSISKDDIIFSSGKFKMNLMFAQRQFEDVLRNLTLDKNHILFIDGIDVRPPTLGYEEYMECIKGLTNAVWSLNSSFFPSIRNSKGRIKVVLLIRPDILDSVGLHNLNNKLKDNAVVLNWKTTYKDYRDSNLFKMADQMLRGQQDDPNSLGVGQTWDYYFPYKVQRDGNRNEYDSSFVPFLRYSFYRPRDIVSLLDIMQKRFVSNSRRDNEVFTNKDFLNSQTQRDYSEHLLGEIKDSLAFYYEVKDYELFLKFFEFLNKYITTRGKRFSYDDFINAYDDLIQYMKRNEQQIPIIFETADIFLQFLYELNIIAYLEQSHTSKGLEEFFTWSFRVRSYANIRPKVRTRLHYILHSGIARALNAYGSR